MSKSDLPIAELAQLAIGIMSLLKPSKFRKDKRNLRMAKNIYKDLLKICKEDGFIDDDEKKILTDLKKNISKRAIELGQS